MTAPPTAFDDFQAGVATALTASEQRGMELFFSKARCSACHNGENFSDELYALPMPEGLNEDQEIAYQGAIDDNAFEIDVALLVWISPRIANPSQKTEGLADLNTGPHCRQPALAVLQSAITVALVPVDTVREAGIGKQAETR